ncbi:hypothetical protein F5I97DRAFT_356032 [Phlebopus sp. FC_14]|nr:hypothetical protein F5I97DRAFT_356032 [Phlebopus sp. FC_14]
MTFDRVFIFIDFLAFVGDELVHAVSVCSSKRCMEVLVASLTDRRGLDSRPFARLFLARTFSDASPFHTRGKQSQFGTVVFFVLDARQTAHVRFIDALLPEF